MLAARESWVGPSFLSTIRQETPCRFSSAAMNRPTGPAPTTNTWVSVAIRYPLVPASKLLAERGVSARSFDAATFSPLARYSHRARSLRRLFGVLAHPFAHEADVISQHVELARIGDRHSQVVCLLLEAVEPRDHLAHVAPAAAGVYHFVFQQPQLSVHAQNFRSHRPVIESRQNRIIG